MIFIFTGNLAFPLLLVGGLFLLSRRQGGGMGGPGGNNPMNFGKSKAKFQMEPNTGITFADVAGVEEAKADFMEVCFVVYMPNGHCCFACLVSIKLSMGTTMVFVPPLEYCCS